MINPTPPPPSLSTLKANAEKAIRYLLLDHMGDIETQKAIRAYLDALERECQEPTATPPIREVDESTGHITYKPTLTFSDALRIARGCSFHQAPLNWGCSEAAAYMQGVDHIINALEAAEKEKRG